jgi:hypothetical protein
MSFLAARRDYLGLPKDEHNRRFYREKMALKNRAVGKVVSSWMSSRRRMCSLAVKILRALLARSNDDGERA